MKVAVVGGTGSFGSAVAKQLVDAGVEVVIGSRDAARAQESAALLGATGATNEDAVRGVDLVLLAVKAEAAVDTARELAAAIGSTPVLSVAAELSFGPGGVKPTAEPTSVAQRIQDVVDAPVVAGLHSLAAASLADAPPDEDALVCGDDADAKALALDLASRLVSGRAVDAGPLASARALEGMTAVIVNVNKRYKAHAGLRVTGRSSDVTAELRVFALQGIPEIEAGDDLGALLAEAAGRAGGLVDGDVLVVAQKVVSKAEGRIVRLDDIEPTERARELSGGERDPRHVQAILDESARVVRSRPPLLISETHHGFVCASAGVDASNAKGPGTLVLLPLDPDTSAARLRDGLRARTGAEVGVIVSDSFGRAWRQGTTDVALGVAGLAALRDLRGVRDTSGYELESTQIAVADEIAGAAELVLGKTSGRPAAVVRGLDVRGEGSGRDLVMPADRDLFR